MSALGLFTQQLEMYRNGEWSAPRIALNPMSDEEFLFAKTMNECDSLRFLSGLSVTEAEVEEFRDGFADLVNLVESTRPEDATTDQQGVSGTAEDTPAGDREILQPMPSLACTLCGLTVISEIWTEEVAAVVETPGFDDADKIKTIKDQ